jgi:diguanylate cyclase
MHKSMQSLTYLAEQGLTITVDDFGKGYSSLSYLHTLPLHTVKIDRGFVKNLSAAHADPTIIRAILAIAKGLHLNFIAEGVETRFQHDYLLEAGCRIAQGYFYSKALSLPQILSYLSASRET